MDELDNRIMSEKEKKRKTWYEILIWEARAFMTFEDESLKEGGVMLQT